MFYKERLRLGKCVWCETHWKLIFFCKLWWGIDVMPALKRIKFSNALFYSCGLKSHSIIRANTEAYFAFQLAKFSSAKYLFFPKKWKNSFCKHSSSTCSKAAVLFSFLPPWCVHLSELKCCMMTNLHYIFSNGWIWIICLGHHGLSVQSHSSTNNSRQWLWVGKEGLTPLQFIINHSFSAPTAPSLLLYVSSCKSHSTHFQLSHFF